MKVLAFLILHTGKPYLHAAIESIIDQVDQIIIHYSAKPSQGFQADIPCPDSRADLFKIASDFFPKVVWFDGEWANENEHINAIWPYTDGYDWVVRFDADEIFPPGIVQEMISQASETDVFAYRVPFVHFWRSFSRVCRDGSHPFRLFKMDAANGERTLDSKNEKWEVLHFGYAQPTKWIDYKIQVSGHRPEWRSDWYKDRWLANAQFDTHPVCFPTHWNPVDYDKETMPEVLKRHPYFSMAVIEE